MRICKAYRSLHRKSELGQRLIFKVRFNTMVLIGVGEAYFSFPESVLRPISKDSLD